MCETYTETMNCLKVFPKEPDIIASFEYCVKSVQMRSFFLVRIFPYSDWVRRDTPYISVFSPNEVKYGPEKTPYLDTFHLVEKPWLKQLLSLKKNFHSDMNNNSLVFNYSETLK